MTQPLIQELDVSLRHAFLSVEKTPPAESPSFVWLKKYEVKFLLIVKKITMDAIRLQKRGEYLNLSFI